MKINNPNQPPLPFMVNSQNDYDYIVSILNKFKYSYPGYGLKPEEHIFSPNYKFEVVLRTDYPNCANFDYINI